MGFFMQKIWNAYHKEIKVGVFSILLFLAFKYLLFYIGPFVLAYLAYEWLSPVTAVLRRTLHLPQAFTGAILFGFFLLVIILVLFSLLTMAARQFSVSYQDIMDVIALCKDRMCDGCMRLEYFLHMEKGSLWDALCQHYVSARMSLSQKWFPKVMTTSVSAIRPFSKVAAFVLIVFVATILLLKDCEKGEKKYGRLLHSFTAEFFSFIKVFLWAQIRIMSTIAIVCLIGLVLCRIPYAIVWAVLTSFLDVLPFIGTGIVLVPMAVWAFFMGRYLDAGILLLTYIACVITRELLEPKLISHSLGISPLLTLAGIYIGLKVFGFGGIILGPIYVMLVTVWYRHVYGIIL